MVYIETNRAISWKKMKKRFPTNIVLVALGIGLFITSLCFFPWAFSFKSEYNNPQGLLFSTSENINQTSEVQTTKFDFAVENVCWQNSSSSAELVLYFLPIISSQTNGTAYFVFQIPYKVTNVQVDVNSESLAQLNGKMTLSFYPSVDHPDDSYILIEIPEQNLFGNARAINVSFTFRFDWNNLIKETHSDYEIDIPFTSFLPQFIQKIGLPPESYSQQNVLNFENNIYAILSIAKPSGSTVTQTIPSADHYGLDNNQLWYS